MSDVVRLGISTCPNDTFAFHALLAGEVDARGIDVRVEFLDVEELNERMLAGGFDVAKVSFHAALHMAERVHVLPSGSALGFGVGPLLLAARGARRERPRVLCPGEWTTATLLYRLLHSGEGELEQVVFSEIMPALREGRADLGVCIHEGRFTWRESGLELVEDLGERWERETGTALPLGGIVARRDLAPGLARRFQDALADSLEWGLAHREACLPTMQRHAQELRPEVVWAHVELYVNEWTRDLGSTGRAALAGLSRLARERGLLAPGAELEIL